MKHNLLQQNLSWYFMHIIYKLTIDTETIITYIFTHIKYFYNIHFVSNKFKNLLA